MFVHEGKEATEALGHCNSALDQLLCRNVSILQNKQSKIAFA